MASPSPFSIDMPVWGWAVSALLALILAALTGYMLFRTVDDNCEAARYLCR